MGWSEKPGSQTIGCLHKTTGKHKFTTTADKNEMVTAVC